MRVGPNWTLFGAVTCVLCAFFANFFTHPDYNFMKHTVGQLAGQQMPNAWIMRLGYIAFGFGIFFDAIQRERKLHAEGFALLVLGICLIGVGAITARSIDPKAFFAAPLANWHSYLYIVAGLALVFAMSIRALSVRELSEKSIHVLAALLMLSTGPLMYFTPEYTGVYDRVGLIIAALWLVVFTRPVGESVARR